eukprot:TRINITY_DN66664_c9_g2_i1.p1 TRINITY_DN66664_c9_g2~~TRINITY_DN66664_c9_g2_i1.p1  ORF type:complete len:355 (-),score=28.48 TRINITY_DN66664_c9_g2_i1:1366-2430(-)
MDKANCLEVVGQRCADVSTSSTSVKLNKDQIADFVNDELSSDAVKGAYSITMMQRWPLKFDTRDHEINFYCWMHMLNFGSAYSQYLRPTEKRGAFGVVQFGMLGYVLGGKKLSGDDMISQTLLDLQQNFNIKAREDRPISKGSPIKQEVDTEVAPFARNILAVLQDTGRRLRELDSKDFATFFRKWLSTEKPSAAYFVFMLQQRFKAFRDVYEPNQKDAADAQPVPLLRKAQVLAIELYRRFKDTEPMFNWADVDCLHAPADHVVVSVLLTRGILTVDEALSKKLQANEPISPQMDMELRAVATCACDELVKAQKGDGEKFNAAQLYWRLLELGKEKEPYKKEPRPRAENSWYV